MCNKSKGLGDGSVKMGMLSANRQLELVSINLITVDKASDGRDSILVIADIFTKFTKAIATRNQTVITVAKVILNEWIYNFGIPEKNTLGPRKKFSVIVGKGVMHDIRCEPK